MSGKIESKQSAVFIHGDDDGRRIMESVLQKVLDNTSLSWFLLGMSEMLEEVSEMDERTASGKPCSEREAELAAEKEFVDVDVAFVVSWSFWLVETPKRSFASETSPPVIVLLRLLV